MSGNHTYEAIVLGASAGGFKVIKQLTAALPEDFSLPIMVVQHVSDASDGSWAGMLDRESRLRVKEADEKEMIVPGTIYLAPANYHLLVEPDRTLTLTVDERVNYARPSIDVLFETAAEAYRERLIGLVYTGANRDGAAGLAHIRANGGLAVAQDPTTAESPTMPSTAIRAAKPQHVLSPEKIIELLLDIHQHQTAEI